MTRLNKGYLLLHLALLSTFIECHRSYVEKKARILGTSEIHLGLVVTRPRDLKKGVGSRPTRCLKKTTPNYLTPISH